MKIKNNSYENDLVPINEVLSQLGYIINYTLGPRAGYVAFTTKDTIDFDYTKDGRTVIDKIVFEGDTENRILNVVKKLVKVIKNESGDGSTSAVMLLSHLVRNALNVLELDNTEEYKRGCNIFRNNIPKVIDKIVKDIVKILELKRTKPTTFDELLNIARISLNNDDTLLHPFVVLFNTLKENNVPCNENNYFDIEPSSTDKYEVFGKQGYSMPVKNFAYTPFKDQNIDESYLLMTKSRINYEDLHYWYYIIETSAVFKNPITVIVSSIEDEAKTALDQFYKDFEAKEFPIKLSIMVSPANYGSTVDTFEDLGYLLNSNITNFEKEYITADTGYGEQSTPFFIKTGNEILDTNPEPKYKAERALFVMKQLYEQLQKTRRCDFRKMGNDLVATVSVVDATAVNEPLTKHIERLRDTSKDENEQVSLPALGRLRKLDASTFVIKVPEHITGDGYRRASAFLDATKAINSSLKDGYIMGGNITPYEATKTLIDELKLSDDEFDNTCKNLVKELSEIKSLYVKDLQPVYNLLLMLLSKSYKDLIHDILGDLSIEEVVNSNRNTICDEIVIEPYLTDYTILLHSITTFSALVTSRLFILFDHVEATRLKSSSVVSTENTIPKINTKYQTQIKKMQEQTVSVDASTFLQSLEKKEENKEEPTVSIENIDIPNPDTPQVPPVTENVNKVNVELDPAEKFAQDQRRREAIQRAYSVPAPSNFKVTGSI